MAEKTIPALPYKFPYHEMLLNGTLWVGNFGVKTGSWVWNHRGPTLLYTSKSRWDRTPAEAYDLDPADFPRGAIVGVGSLVIERELTEVEKFLLLVKLNNVHPNDRGELVRRGEDFFDGRPYIAPYPRGRFFLDLRRFKKPIYFNPKPGAVRIINVPVRVVREAMKQVGYENAIR